MYHVKPGKTFYFLKPSLRPLRYFLVQLRAIRWPAREWKAAHAWRSSSCHGNPAWALEENQSHTERQNTTKHAVSIENTCWYSRNLKRLKHILHMTCNVCSMLNTVNPKRLCVRAYEALVMFRRFICEARARLEFKARALSQSLWARGVPNTNSPLYETRRSWCASKILCCLYRLAGMCI